MRARGGALLLAVMFATSQLETEAEVGCLHGEVGKKPPMPWVAWCSQTAAKADGGKTVWTTYLTLRAGPGRNVAERYPYKLPGEIEGTAYELCDLNDGYAEVWEGHGRTEYHKVAISIAKKDGNLDQNETTATYVVDVHDAKYSTSVPAGADVAFGTAEECYADSAVHSFSCPSRGTAAIDLGGTPFSLAPSFADVGVKGVSVEKPGNKVVVQGANKAVEIKCGSGGCGEDNGCSAAAGTIELRIVDTAGDFEHAACRAADDEAAAAAEGGGPSPKCSNGGLCIPEVGSATDADAGFACVCEPGWTGADCSDTCDELNFGPGCTASRTCLNGGEASSITGACICTPGWVGTDCQEFDYCSSNDNGGNGADAGSSSVNGETCRNDGVCTNLVYDAVATAEGKCQFPFVYNGQRWESCVEPGDDPPFCLTENGVKADCIIKATRPTPLLAPLNSAPANAGSSSTNVGCVETGIGETIVLSCADASQRAIATIDFATFGLSTGMCGSYVVDPSARKAGCTTDAFQSMLEEQCIGKPSCALTISVDTLPTSVAKCISDNTADSNGGNSNSYNHGGLLKVEYSCGYTANEGSWVDIDLGMLQRGDAAAKLAGVDDGDPDYISFADQVISTGCVTPTKTEMRTAWTPPADGGQAARQFLGFPDAACSAGSKDDATGESAIKNFGVVQWKINLPFTFTKVRGKFRLKNYGSAHNAASPTMPADLDEVDACTWDDGNALVGPDKSGFVLFGTQDRMLYCGGRGGVLTDATARTVGVDLTAVPPAKSLQFQVAADGEGGSILLSDLLIQVFYPITQNVDAVLYRYNFDSGIATATTSAGPTHFFAPTYPKYTKADGDPEDNGGLFCAANGNSLRNCPTYTQSGSSGMMYWRAEGPPALLTFMTPGALGFVAGNSWTMLAWIRPQYQLSLDDSTLYQPAPLLCGRDSSGYAGASGSALCLGAVKGKAAVQIGSEVFTTPWAIKNLEWSHVGFVVEETRVRVYVNDRESILDLALAFVNDARLEIGGSTFSQTDPVSEPLRYTGYVDEIRFYSRALTEFEIRDRAGWMPPSDDPSVEFQFEGTFEESRFDRLVEQRGSDAGCDGCSFSDEGGINGKGVLVPLTNYINLVKLARLLPASLTNSFTISFWVKTSSGGGSGGGNAGDPSSRIVMQTSGNDGAVTDSPRLYVSIGKGYALQASFDGMTVEGNSLKTPAWTHILLRHAVSRAYGTRTFALFVNGAGSEASASTTDVVSFGEDALLILGDQTTSARGGALLLDELSVYDVALDDNTAIHMSSKYGATGISASLANCDFGTADMCGWYGSPGKAGTDLQAAVAPWNLVASSSMSDADHTYSSVTLATAAASEGTCSDDDGVDGPCFVTVNSIGGSLMGSNAALQSPALLQPKVPEQCTLSFWYHMDSARAVTGQSAKNCTDLAWKLPAEDATVCGSAKFSNMADSKLPPTCSWHGKEYGMYIEAEAACLAQGARLCTIDELHLDIVDDSDCDQGQPLVWTSTPCTDPPEGKDAMEYASAVHSGRNANGEVEAPKCVSKVEPFAKLQCCADAVKAKTTLTVVVRGAAQHTGTPIWSSADAHGRGSGWARALVPLGPILTSDEFSGGRSSFVAQFFAVDAGGDETDSATAVPMAAIDDVSFDGCEPPTASDTLQRIVAQTVIVDTNGDMVSGSSKEPWTKVAGNEGEAAMQSPMSTVTKSGTLSVVSNSGGSSDLLVPGARDFRLSATISLKLDASVATVDSLGKLTDGDVAFSLGFNDVAGSVGVGGLLSISGTGCTFTGALFGDFACAIPHAPLTEATMIQVDMARLGSVLIVVVAFDGVAESTTISVGRALLARLELSPKLARVLLYSCVFDQAIVTGSTASASTTSSSSTSRGDGDDPIRTLVIPVHSAADVALEVKSSDLGLCVDEDEFCLNVLVSAREEVLEMGSTAAKESGSLSSSKSVEQLVAVRFQGVALSRDDSVHTASIQFTANQTSGNGSPSSLPPSIKVTAALSPDAPPLVPLYQPPLPLVPVQRATEPKIQAGGTVMIESSVSSEAACTLLSNGAAQYVYRGGFRVNGEPTSGMVAQHGAYRFTGLTTAIPSSESNSAAHVILKIACEVLVLKDGTPVPISTVARTKSSVTWKPTAWTEGDAGDAQQVVDLAPLVRELIALPEWHQKSAITFFFEGATTASNRRTAVGWAPNDADLDSQSPAASVPTLIIEATAAVHSQLEHVETSCVFPFSYQGISYFSCIDAEQVPPPGSSSTDAWCGTEAVVEGGASWGTCTSHLVSTAGGNGGDAPEVSCVFPFVARGETFYSCTQEAIPRAGIDSVGNAGGKPGYAASWCSLTTNFDEDGKWGFCLVPTYGGTTPGAACSFPFWSHSVEYTACTTDGGRGGNGGGSRPWCATGFTSHLDLDGPAEWGYCSDGSETERSWGSQCSCAAGFAGDRCQSACYSDSFGKDCLEACDDCGAGGQCDGITGQCVAAAEFTCAASTVDGACGGGKGSKCNDDGKSCECAAGLLPPFCLQGCPPGRFGVDCKSRCSDACSAGGCDPITGMCLECSPGWKGIDCSQPCTDNTFGEGCLQECTCNGNDQTCDAITGQCQCDPHGNYVGLRCNVHKAYTYAGVFINEIKFAAGSKTDSVNAIEVAGPAGTSLNNFRFHFYHSNTDPADARAAGNDHNDAAAGTYYGDFVLSGLLRNMKNGFGVLVFNLPPAFANRSYGRPSWLLGDGIALVSDTGRVLQFISYGSDLTSAGSGPVPSGTRAESIPAVNGIPGPGLSVQLVGGPGMYSQDFTWATSAMDSTLNRINPDQEFGQPTVPPIRFTVRMVYYGADGKLSLAQLLARSSFAEAFAGALQVGLGKYAVVIDGDEQVSEVVGIYKGGSPPKFDVAVEVSPTFGNNPPLPSWTAVRAALVRARTIYIAGFPVQVEAVVVGPYCQPGFVVSPSTGKCILDDGANGDDDDDGVNTSDGSCSGGQSGPIATCFDCVRTSSLQGCNWDQGTQTCAPAGTVQNGITTFACTPYKNSCCAGLTVGASGFAGSCSSGASGGGSDSAAGGVPSAAVSAIASALDVSLEGAEIYFGQGCKFLSENNPFCDHYGYENCIIAGGNSGGGGGSSSSTAATAAPLTKRPTAVGTATTTTIITSTHQLGNGGTSVPVNGAGGSTGQEDEKSNGGKVLAGLAVVLLLSGLGFFVYWRRKASGGRNGMSNHSTLYQNLQFDMQFEAADEDESVWSRA